MIAVGILASIIGYAMIYSGVVTLQHPDQPTGILESLNPRFDPAAKASPPAGSKPKQNSPPLFAGPGVTLPGLLTSSTGSGSAKTSPMV